jgi:hypothetical protein
VQKHGLYFTARNRQSSPELQYIIELWADGMVHADSTLFTCTEALKALRDRRRASRNLE